MNPKKRYRRFLLWCLGLDLLVIGILGIRYLNLKIPDEIHVEKGKDQDVSAMLARPFVTFEDTVPVSGDGAYFLPCRLFGLIPFKDVKVIPAESTSLLVSGSTVGMYMKTEGVLIIDTGEILSRDGKQITPAEDLVKPGDYIVAFNQQKVSCKKELIKDLKKTDGKEVSLTLNRQGKKIKVSLMPVEDQTGDYKLGIWVRDDTQGIGTLTYVDAAGNYGALGHGISDVDTAGLLDIQEGTLYQAQILAVSRGSRGNPGELAGMIRYDNSNVLGSIQENCKNGIYGQMDLSDAQKLSLVKMPVAHKQEIETGPALIRCSVDGHVKEYEAQIKRIDLNHEDSNKSFILQVTDEELLEKTGGVVQGMSGSPVIQNGKLAGAVTHVFVQDSTSGYGIFAETMMEHENYKMT